MKKQISVTLTASEISAMCVSLVKDLPVREELGPGFRKHTSKRHSQRFTKAINGYSKLSKARWEDPTFVMGEYGN